MWAAFSVIRAIMASQRNSLTQGTSNPGSPTEGGAAGFIFGMVLVLSVVIPSAAAWQHKSVSAWWLLVPAFTFAFLPLAGWLWHANRRFLGYAPPSQASLARYANPPKQSRGVLPAAVTVTPDLPWLKSAMPANSPWNRTR